MCVCGAAMTLDYAMTCPAGGYPAPRHDAIRNTVAEAMAEVYRDFMGKPRLLPLSGEQLRFQTASHALEAQLGICAAGFWTRHQDAFFDARVTHKNAFQMSVKEVQEQLSRQKAKKKREYAEHVREVGRGHCTLLVFSTNGLRISVIHANLLVWHLLAWLPCLVSLTCP